MNIDEIRKQFQPVTKGGYQYRILEEFEGMLFGRWKPNNGPWSSVHWLSDGTNQYSQGLDLIPVPPPELTIQWDKLPEWLPWFAIDEDGNGFLYTNEPSKQGYYWSPNGGDCCHVPPRYFTNPCISWDKSLRRRPQNK